MLAPHLNVVVVEDHELLREAVVELMREQGHRTIGLDCTEALSDEAGGTPIDVLIVDLNLPGEDGLSLARRLRTVQPQAGIIMMTAREAVADRVVGYDSGADIYLVKPVPPDELVAAVGALARRLSLGARPQRSRASDGQALLLDQRHLRLRGGRGETSISDAESTMLAALARAPGQRLERWQLLELQGLDDEVNGNGALEVRIVRLRARLRQVGADPQAIRALRSWGYQLCVPLQLA